MSVLTFKTMERLTDDEIHSLWKTNLTDLQTDESIYSYLTGLEKKDCHLSENMTKKMEMIPMVVGTSFDKKNFLSDAKINPSDILYSSVHDTKTTIVMHDGTNREEDISKYLFPMIRPVYIWRESKIGSFESCSSPGTIAMKRLIVSMHEAIETAGIGCRKYINQAGHEAFILTSGEKEVIKNMIDSNNDQSFAFMRDDAFNNNEKVIIIDVN